jgi:hypothetical protein
MMADLFIALCAILDLAATVLNILPSALDSVAGGQDGRSATEKHREKCKCRHPLHSEFLFKILVLRHNRGKRAIVSLSLGLHRNLAAHRQPHGHRLVFRHDRIPREPTGSRTRARRVSPYRGAVGGEPGTGGGLEASEPVDGEPTKFPKRPISEVAPTTPGAAALSVAVEPADLSDDGVAAG